MTPRYGFSFKINEAESITFFECNSSYHRFTGGKLITWAVQIRNGEEAE